VLDGVRVPFTLLGFRVKSVFAQTTQDFADMLLMGSHVTRNEVMENVIHHILEGGWRVHKTKEHDKWFK
ncbi:hypothetical protein PAXINDRAFT_39220, partial [Paxillus involutus ATCC 200175]